MAYRFEIYKDNENNYRARFKAPNGETMFSTEGYSSKTSVLNTVASIQSNSPSAVIDDRSNAPLSK
jgi:uncharacterized protein YegP (UPF0339 family)